MQAFVFLCVLLELLLEVLLRFQSRAIKRRAVIVGNRKPQEKEN